MAVCQFGSPAKRKLESAFYRSTAERCRLEWAIVNFDAIFQGGPDALQSSVFPSSSTTFTSSSMWRLKIDPKQLYENKESILFYLERCVSGSKLFPEVKAAVRIGICRTNGEILSNPPFVGTFSEGETIHIYGVDRKEILHEIYLPKDTLTVHCELDVYSTQCKAFFDDIFEKSPPGFQELSNDMTTFAIAVRGTDITLKNNDREAIQCHKAVLSSRSPVFATEIENCNEDFLEMKDIDYETIDPLLGYIYNGNLSLLFTAKEHVLHKLFEAAKKYQLTDLESFLEPEVIAFRSVVQANKYKFEWKIENFSKCLDGSSAEYDGPTSRWFSTIDAEWRVLLSIKNSKKKKQNSVSVHLLRRANKLVFHQVRFRVKLVAVPPEDDIDCGSIECAFFEDGQFGINIPRAIEELLEKREKYLPNDTLSLVCRFSVSTGNVVSANEKNSFSIVCDLVDEKDSDLQSLSDDFEKLFLQNKLQDMSIKARNAEFNVHKCIIEARCRELILSEAMKEKLAEMPSEVVESFLRFLYTGDGKYLDGHALQLYVLANDLDLDNLKQRYITRLGWILSKSNILSIIQEAHRIGDSQLKSMALAFITEVADDVLRMKQFSDLEIANRPLAEEILLLIAQKVQ